MRAMRVMRGTRSRVLLSFAVLPVVLFAVLVVTGLVTTAATARAGHIRVMTYNIRFADNAPPHAWAQRLPQMVKRLKTQDPDLLGVQEAYWPQMRDLAAALPEYAWVGMGVRGGTAGEFTAIFYRRDRFDLLDFDHFWLSATPTTIGSKTWGNAYVRMVTWVKLRDRRSRAVFYQLNTHLDNGSGESRTRSAQLVLKQMKDFTPGVPVVMTGDFNAPAGTSRTFAILTGPGGFTDTWATATRRGSTIGTLGDWKPPVPDGPRIDWILARGRVRTLATQIDPYAHDGAYASDHYPVIADIVISP